MGAIEELSPLGGYLADNLQLRLARHQFIWQVERIKALAKVLIQLKGQMPRESLDYYELADAISEFFGSYLEYLPLIHEP